MTIGPWFRRSTLVGALAFAVAGTATAAIALAPNTSPPRDASNEPIPTGKATVPWRPTPPRPGEVVYESLGIRTMPAPPDAEPSVTLTDVMASEEVQQYTDGGLASGEPTVALRLVTTGDFGPTDATPIVAAHDELSWVLAFHHSPVDLHGPAGSEDAAAPDVDCDVVIMISATSGNALSYSQQCPPVAPRVTE